MKISLRLKDSARAGVFPSLKCGMTFHARSVALPLFSLEMFWKASVSIVALGCVQTK